MQRCPRCHTSMLLAKGQMEEGYRPLWHCLSCGQEVLADAEEQARDDRVREHLTLAGYAKRKQDVQRW